jgi:TRAP-type mannitol/chloroaromatic compound transport system substrate-binding protein
MTNYMQNNMIRIEKNVQKRLYLEMSNQTGGWKKVIEHVKAFQSRRYLGKMIEPKKGTESEHVRTKGSQHSIHNNNY